MGVELPSVTLALIAISRFFTKFWALLAALAAGGVIAYKFYSRTEKGRTAHFRNRLKLPALGKIDLMRAASQFAHTMIQLDAILSAATDYQMTFSDVQFGDELVSRPIQMTFSAGSYSAAKTILSDLYNCRYCCSLSDITVTSKGAGADSSAAAQGDVTAQSVSVKLTATFFEKYDSAAAAEKSAATSAADAAASGT